LSRAAKRAQSPRKVSQARSKEEAITTLRGRKNISIRRWFVGTVDRKKKKKKDTQY